LPGIIENHLSNDTYEIALKRGRVVLLTEKTYKFNRKEVAIVPIQSIRKERGVTFVLIQGLLLEPRQREALQTTGPEHLPYDLFVQLVLNNHIRGKDLANLCASSPVINRYCNRDNQDLFRRLILQQYGYDYNIMESEYTPREMYNYLTFRGRDVYAMDAQQKVTGKRTRYTTSDNKKVKFKSMAEVNSEMFIFLSEDGHIYYEDKKATYMYDGPGNGVKAALIPLPNELPEIVELHNSALLRDVNGGIWRLRYFANEFIIFLVDDRTNSRIVGSYILNEGENVLNTISMNGTLLPVTFYFLKEGQRIPLTSVKDIKVITRYFVIMSDGILYGRKFQMLEEDYELYETKFTNIMTATARFFIDKEFRVFELLAVGQNTEDFNTKATKLPVPKSFSATYNDFYAFFITTSGNLVTYSSLKLLENSVTQIGMKNVVAANSAVTSTVVLGDPAPERNKILLRNPKNLVLRK
jgi:hypothetical protein